MKWHENDMKMTWKWHENDMKMTWKWYENDKNYLKITWNKNVKSIARKWKKRS